MSVEVPKPTEETPVVTKPVEATEPAETVAPATEPAADATAATSEEPATEVLKTEDDKVIVEAKPASEGTLGYKAPGFLKQFVFSKHFFWFNEEASTAESLAHYINNEKPEHAHHAAAWAQETGKGVLFYTKRAEDKTHPAGLILLADAVNVVKEGANEFSFTVNKKTHKFEAPTTAERDSWVVAVEKALEASKEIKDEVTGRDTYKKTLEGFAVPAVVAAKSERSSSKAPKKSLDATTATAAATEEPAAKEEAAEPVAEEKKVEEKKAEKKERSQSRKRASVFGGIFNKKEEDKEAKEAKKAEKEAEKAEKEIKKAEAEQVKLDKKAEAEAKKDEAKETHEAAPAVEAVEAAAVAAAPAAVVAAVENKKEKDHAKEAEAETAASTDKKSKRASVFGGLFSKKVTSPTAEKSEKDATAPAETTEVPPVSETAPKLDEPIETKPIDTAEVTAPVDTVETPAATEAAVEEPAKDAPAATTETSPKTEKKGGFLGFIKNPKKEQKEIQKEIQKEEAEEKKTAAEITGAATTEAATEPAAETTAAETTKDERATREKRRSSFFGSLGTIKKKSSTPVEGSDSEAAPEVKREKSPLPSKLGGMFRKSSKTVKPAETEAATTEAAVAEAPAAETAATETPETKIVGDVVPEDLTAETVHDAVTTAPTEVKASA